VDTIGRIVCIVLACVGLLALSGCASGPAVIRTSVTTDSGVNPDSRGRPSPVVVRLLELKSLTGFESADFFSLFERDKETLGADLVAREELQLRPGEQRSFERTLQADTTYVGVIAAFRDLERARWRAAVPVKPKKSMPLIIKIDALAVSMSTAK